MGLRYLLASLQQFHSTLYYAYASLSMPGLWTIHVGKRGIEKPNVLDEFDQKTKKNLATGLDKSLQIKD